MRPEEAAESRELHAAPTRRDRHRHPRQGDRDRGAPAHGAALRRPHRGALRARRARRHRPAGLRAAAAAGRDRRAAGAPARQGDQQPALHLLGRALRQPAAPARGVPARAPGAGDRRRVRPYRLQPGADRPGARHPGDRLFPRLRRLAAAALAPGGAALPGGDAAARRGGRGVAVPARQPRRPRRHPRQHRGDPDRGRHRALRAGDEGSAPDPGGRPHRRQEGAAHQHRRLRRRGARRSRGTGWRSSARARCGPRRKRTRAPSASPTG